jgi:hypothetical protein
VSRWQAEALLIQKAFQEVGQNTFSDKRNPAEDDRIAELVSGIDPVIRKRRHHSLRALGLY